MRKTAGPGRNASSDPLLSLQVKAVGTEVPIDGATRWATFWERMVIRHESVYNREGANHTCKENHDAYPYSGR